MDDETAGWTDRRSLLRAGVTAAGTALTGALAGCTARQREGRVEDGRVVREVPVGEAEALRVTVPRGSIEVTGDENRETLRASVRASDRGGEEGAVDRAVEFVEELLAPLLGEDRAQVEAVREGGEVTLRVPADDPVGALGADLDVVVPGGLDVREVRTSDGPVEVGDVAGDVTVATDTGRATVDSVDGYPAAEVGTGDVRIEDATGIGDVRVGEGNVAVEVPDLRGEALVETGGGELAAELAPDLNAVVEATSRDGEVTVEEGLFDAVPVEEPGRVRGRLGGPDPDRELELVTDAGAVRLTALRGA